MSCATSGDAGQPQMPLASAKVAVVTTAGCPYCKRVKAALREAEIDFQELDLSNKIEVLDSVKRASGQSTVPQVFIGGNLFGGSAEVISALRDGSFVKTLDAATVSPLPESIIRALEDSNNSETSLVGIPAEDESISSELVRLRQISEGMIAAGLLGGPSAPLSVKNAVDWLQKEHGLGFEEATRTLSEMQSRQMVTITTGADPKTPLTSSVIHKHPASVALEWTALLPLPNTWDQPLNCQFEWFGPARSAIEVSADLRRRILALYDRYLDPDGRHVRYKAMSQDPDFLQFTLATAELQSVDVEGLDREEAMCFWINLYNSIIVHATATVGPPQSTFDRLRWFGAVNYIVGGQKFSCNDIEHGILRGNAASPTAMLSLLGFSSWAPPMFRPGDPRRSLFISPVDPRIHFALNCGATSCPPIRVYSPGSLERGLESAAEAFCGGEVDVDPNRSTVTLSSIFKWYGRDFGTKADLIQFLVDHVPPGKTRGALEEAVRIGGGADGVRLKYSPYDWSVNAVE